jgi:hypothetical protein
MDPVAVRCVAVDQFSCKNSDSFDIGYGILFTCDRGRVGTCYGFDGENEQAS